MKILVLNGGKLSSIEGAVIRFKNLIIKGRKHEVNWADPVYSRSCYKTEELDKEVPKNVKLIPGKKVSSNPLLELMEREKHFLKVVRENECDVCVFYNSWGTYLARKYLKSKRIPVVFDYIDLMHLFRSGNVEKAVARKSTAQALRESDLVITTAHTILEDAKKYNPKAVLIPNGVDFDEARKAKKLKINHPAVGFVGGFGEWVDWDLILEVAKKDRNISFYFIGDGYGRKKIEEAGKGSHNIMVSESFVPFQEARNWMTSFDACVIPFKVNELTDAVCPLKLFEYWALKKPVIVTRTYELGKIIKDEATFASSAKEWEETISKICSDKKKAKKLGEKGFEKAKQYDWKKLGKKYERELEKLVSK